MKTAGMLKRMVNRYVVVMQKALIGASLFFVYLFGFGITALFLLVADRRMLFDDTGGSRWRPADGYAEDIDGSGRGS